ncbi:MAG: hypothetical protein A2512_08960 [Deltaproteobacteria bacterium RIFOXYD12_FULL_56_24]|nr:MAG: hypothetical protein A2512_08960 [Deltaproteobacteria bacterium RIFOXYD12_FULL_56_24]
MKTLGERIKIIRGATSREKFAPALGVSKNTIVNYETGTRAPDTNFVVRLLDLYPDIDPTWLLTGEGQMYVEPRYREAAVDLAKDLLLGDKDAAKRRQEKRKGIGSALRSAREATGQVWHEIGGDTLPEPQTAAEKQLSTALAGLKTRYEAAELGRLAAEQQANELAVGPAAKAAGGTGDFHLSMGDSMELLVNIHKSGNNILIRAINANLMAFNEAIENRTRSETTINAIREMREQMNVMQGDLATLRQENQELQRKLLSRGDREQEKAAG